MIFRDRTDLETVLDALGETLEAEGDRVSLIVAGGAALSLLGMIDRATQDIDVLARLEDSSGEQRFTRPIPLPERLQKSIERVARDFGLAPNWINTRVAEQWVGDPPEELFQDVEWRSFSSLRIGWVGRQALISLKLHATADRDRDSVHYQDLVVLAPDVDELTSAREFVLRQDKSPAFPAIVDKVIAHVRRAVDRDR